MNKKGILMPKKKKNMLTCKGLPTATVDVTKLSYSGTQPPLTVKATLSLRDDPDINDLIEQDAQGNLVVHGAVNIRFLLPKNTKYSWGDKVEFSKTGTGSEDGDGKHNMPKEDHVHPDPRSLRISNYHLNAGPPGTYRWKFTLPFNCPPDGLQGILDPDIENQE